MLKKIVLFLCFALCVAQISHAANHNWIGGGASGNWSDLNSWDPPSFLRGPEYGDTATLNLAQNFSLYYDGGTSSSYAGRTVYNANANIHLAGAGTL